MGSRQQQAADKTRFIATRDAYGAALLELGKKRKDIVALDADLTGSTKTSKFFTAFPDRCFNLGISEQDMIGVAGGLSLTGKVPFASTFAMFEAGRAWEQVRQTVCYSGLNVKLVATHSGLTVGEDGASHQALEDIALMRVLPGMTVIIPADGPETEQVINVIADYYGPVYVRLGRVKVPVVMPEDYRFEIGKAHVFNFGMDANIVATGIMLAASLEAQKLLMADGIDAGVIHMPTVKPLDEAALLSAADASKLVVTAEEHSIIGGLGSAVSEFLSGIRPVMVKRVGVRDEFGRSGKPDELLRLYGLTADNIAETVKSGL